jgi:hypothetical protein
MSRYDEYLRGHKEPQEMKHPILRMQTPASVNREDRRRATNLYDSPQPSFGYANVKGDV